MHSCNGGENSDIIEESAAWGGEVGVEGKEGCEFEGCGVEYGEEFAAGFMACPRQGWLLKGFSVRFGYLEGTWGEVIVVYRVAKFCWEAEESDACCHD